MSLKNAVQSRKERENTQKQEAIANVTAEAMKRLNVNVPTSKYRSLKIKAAKEDKEISELVNKWIDEYISN